MKIEDLPKIIPIFPLSNFIIFPKTTVPLNIFEPRYIDMINDSMKSNKMIGMIQPKNLTNDENIPKLYKVGCLGKITSFTETEDGRFLIELKGIQRFTMIREIETNKKYRTIEIEFKNLLNSFEVMSSKLFAIVNLVKGLYSNAVISNFLKGNISLSRTWSSILIFIILFDFL